MGLCGHVACMCHVILHLHPCLYRHLLSTSHNVSLSAPCSWWSPSAEWPAPFDKAFVLNLALAVGGDWPGPPNDATQFPATLAVDYVRVFAALK